jgi:hypothetical protein
VSTSDSTQRQNIRRTARRLLFSSIFAAGFSFSVPSSAWDGAVTGTITGIDSVANETNNYEIRIYVSGASVYCTTTATFAQGYAYMNASDANYHGTLAVLLTAYATGKQVELFTMNDGGNGCHLHYIQVR